MALFETGKVFQLMTLLGLIAVIYYYFTQADKGKSYFVRRIAGVDIIDEALERATELGRPVHFSVGDLAELSGSNVPQVIAGFECLEHIAAHCAKLKQKLIVSLCGRSGGGGELVPITNELVRNVYKMNGALDDFKIGDTVRYVGGESAVYHSAMQRIFVEEHVATNILIGPWAGSIHASTALGNAMGVYQVTGTALLWDMPEQICLVDYFIIGEEIFAAGAVLSGDRNAAASLQVHDLVKYYIWFFTILGVVFLAAGSNLILTILRS